ncbi:MAG: 2Fe-2S iron-sulfur cluster-binding protein [Halodesulfurarchaeum sp.]
MPTHTVEFVGTGETIEVAETETVLDVAIREGISQEYSCRVGMCLACSAKIESGEVTQPAARGLTEEEAEEYALTCMARPQSDLKLRRGEYPPSIETDGVAEEQPADD